MKAIIKKWGNSLGVRIPGHMVKDLSLEDGTTVEITEEENHIIIRPKRKKSLKDILGLITPENTHEVHFDAPMGNEQL